MKLDNDSFLHDILKHSGASIVDIVFSVGAIIFFIGSKFPSRSGALDNNIIGWYFASTILLFVRRWLSDYRLHYQ